MSRLSYDITGFFIVRFKDGTEIAGQTSNELTLTNLNTADAGFYKCSAKSTVSDTLPAAVSQEALLTITGKVVVTYYTFSQQ